jgi:hypothetical protein
MTSILFCVIACLLFCYVVAGPKAQKLNVNNKVDRIWKGAKLNCERKECSKLIPEEAYNCVNKCLSPDCFDEIYSENLLEDGEIDSVRSKTFTACIRQEIVKQQDNNKKKKARNS